MSLVRFNGPAGLFLGLEHSKSFPRAALNALILQGVKSFQTTIRGGRKVCGYMFLMVREARRRSREHRELMILSVPEL